MATGGGGGLTVPDVGHQRADSQGDLEEATTGPRRIRQHAEPSQPVTIGLDQDLAWLWGKFLPLPNEMVVNRPGRYVFRFFSRSGWSVRAVHGGAAAGPRVMRWRALCIVDMSL